MKFFTRDYYFKKTNLDLGIELKPLPRNANYDQLYQLKLSEYQNMGEDENSFQQQLQAAKKNYQLFIPAELFTKVNIEYLALGFASLEIFKKLKQLRQLFKKETKDIEQAYLDYYHLFKSKIPSETLMVIAKPLHNAKIINGVIKDSDYLLTIIMNGNEVKTIVFKDIENQPETLDNDLWLFDELYFKGHSLVYQLLTTNKEIEIICKKIYFLD